MNAILRTFRNCTLVAIIVLMSLFSGQAQSFSVTTINDTPDSNPGDGLCDDGTGSCSLRAAIMEANSLGGTAATIAIPAGVYELSIIGINENTGLTGDLDITSNITITGAGAQSTIINADSIDRVFHVLTGGILTLSQLQVTEGFADRNNGGGIFNEGVLNI
ncbi:MAG: CSLREA domain-containing protein, partial [Crocinitomicaceae bacterium]|nr:CSLREA domain-containing protein [Crocinitomicaceae bacterium]